MFASLFPERGERRQQPFALVSREIHTQERIEKDSDHDAVDEITKQRHTHTRTLCLIVLSRTYPYTTIRRVLRGSTFCFCVFARSVRRATIMVVVFYQCVCALAKMDGDCNWPRVKQYGGGGGSGGRSIISGAKMVPASNAVVVARFALLRLLWLPCRGRLLERRRGDHRYCLVRWVYFFGGGGGAGCPCCCVHECSSRGKERHDDGGIFRDVWTFFSCSFFFFSRLPLLLLLIRGAWYTPFGRGERERENALFFMD